MANLITLSLPCILSFGDYHEINYLVEKLHKMRFSEHDYGHITECAVKKSNIKAVELSFMNGEYQAIFYTGNKNNVDYKEMVKAHEAEAKTAEEEYQPKYIRRRR